jgi:hypothetical protein
MPEEKQPLPERKLPVNVARVLVHEGVVARSEFPHPLVTIDYDSDGKIVQVVIVGGDLRVSTYTGQDISPSTAPA